MVIISTISSSGSDLTLSIIGSWSAALINNLLPYISWHNIGHIIGSVFSYSGQQPLVVAPAVVGAAVVVTVVVVVDVVVVVPGMPGIPVMFVQPKEEIK